MAGADQSPAPKADSHRPPERAALAARRRRLYAGILAGFVHDTAASRGLRSAPLRAR